MMIAKFHVFNALISDTKSNICVQARGEIGPEIFLNLTDVEAVLLIKELSTVLTERMKKKVPTPTDTTSDR